MKVMSIIGIIIFTVGLSLYFVLPEDSGDNQWISLVKGLWIFYIRYMAIIYGLSLSIVGLVVMNRKKTMIGLSIVGIFIFIIEFLLVFAQVQTSDNLMRMVLIYFWLVYGISYSIISLISLTRIKTDK